MFSKFICGLFFLVILFASCSESNENENVYANWKERNEAFFNKMYAKADSASHAGSSEWKIIRKWSLQEQFGIQKDNNIVVHVLESHAAEAMPLYTDSVVVDIQGCLMPTANDEDGYVFYSTFSQKKRDLKSDIFITISAKGMLVNREIDGLSTAVQNMHEGDRWKVYVPYNLAFQQQSIASPLIPAYSTLVFDITLVRIKH